MYGHVITKFSRMGSLPHFVTHGAPLRASRARAPLKIGSLISKDDGDGNENGKKAIGLDWQNNNFARASRFFVHFFNVAARLRSESA